MKKLILISILLLLTGSLKSQKTIKIKKDIIEISSKKRGQMLKSVEYQKNIYLLFTTGAGRKTKMILKKYDIQMNFLNENQLEYNYKEGSYYGFFEFGGKLIMTFLEDDKKADKMSFFSKTVDTKTLSLSTNKKSLLSVPYKNRRDKVLPIFEVSRKKGSMLISYIKNTKSKEDQTMGFLALDKNLDKLWFKEIKVPYRSKTANLYDKEIDEEGNLYFVIRHRDIVKKRKYHYKLYSCMDNAETVTSFDLLLKEDIISDVKLAISKQGEVLASGFYSEEQEGKIKGAFFSKLDIENQKMISQSKKEIAIDLLKKGETEKTRKRIDKRLAKGKKLELWNFDINEIVLRDDGGAVLIAEKFYTYTTTSTTTSGGVQRTTTTVHYVYGDIIVISINAKGEIDWVNKIIKNQNSTTRYFSSYALALVKDKMYFIFNDNYRNYDTYNETRKRKNKRHGMDLSKKRGIVSVFEITFEGYTKKEILINNSELKGNLIPMNHHQITNNKLVVFVRGKKPQAAMLTFKK